MRLFADDSKVYSIIYDEEYERQLQRDLATLQQWSENWQFRFHPDKCDVARVSHERDRSSYPYKLLGSTFSCFLFIYFSSVRGVFGVPFRINQDQEQSRAVKY